MGKDANFVPAALRTALALEAMPSTTRAGPRRLVSMPSPSAAVVGLSGAVPTLPDSWCRPERWSTIIEGSWQFIGEHINIKEARVVLVAF